MTDLPVEPIRVVSVTVASDPFPDARARALADAFMSLDQVVTVRVEPSMGQVIYRADVPRGDRAQAVGLAELVLRRHGLRFTILDAQVLDRRDD